MTEPSPSEKDLVCLDETSNEDQDEDERAEAQWYQDEWPPLLELKG